MTTEDTLTAIDATLNGYVTWEGADGMRWSPVKPKPPKRTTKAEVRAFRAMLAESEMSPARDAATYVENTTSRELEGQ